MKTILHVFSTLNKGGAESRVMDLYRALDKTQTQFAFAVTTPGEHFYMEDIRSQGGKIYYVKSRREIGLTAWLRQWKEIFAELQPHAVHSHTGFDSSIIVLVAWMFRVPKRLCHARDMMSSSSFAGRGRQHICRLMMRIFSTDLVACSTEAGGFLFGKRTMRKRGILLPNAVDLEKITSSRAAVPAGYRPSLQIETFDYVIGSVGNLRPVKNQRFMLDIMKSLLQVRSNGVLLIAGEGEERQGLLRHAEELGIQENVRLLGQRNDIPQLLSVLDLFLLTSFSEGLPGCVVEALACNLPCLISDTITRDLDIGTGLLSYCSLDAPLSQWRDTAMAMMDAPRPIQEDTLRLLRSHGFGVHEALRRLLTIYAL